MCTYVAAVLPRFVALRTATILYHSRNTRESKTT